MARRVALNVGWMFNIMVFTGPVAVLLTTPLQPLTSEYEEVTKETLDLLESNEGFRTSITIHLLRSTVARTEDNAPYLNLACLLSKTARVLLSPRGISAPHLSMRDMNAKLAGSRQPVAFVAPLAPDTQAPLAFEFQPQSGMVLPRDVNLWCPERYFGSNVSSFRECPWYFWLHFGDICHGPHIWTKRRSTYQLPHKPLVLFSNISGRKLA